MLQETGRYWGQADPNGMHVTSISCSFVAIAVLQFTKYGASGDVFVLQAGSSKAPEQDVRVQPDSLVETHTTKKGLKRALILLLKSYRPGAQE